ncbi:CDGSH iron-sulfur domain-containing protein [Rhodophyticola sp. CCM32]|uniref:CDGSH iron-sulfur domain-containing protein n=1 Tax=Rhodophyticola sp. CCM32 TaxID=2916397 RepID=UPI001EE5AE2E|nr:CDGSH iron-sulfur domain-containing protein [Rhodophyticola sp. CCM32]
MDSAKERFLCRCGASANMPYCDDSHKAAGLPSAQTRKPLHCLNIKSKHYRPVADMTIKTVWHLPPARRWQLGACPAPAVAPYGGPTWPDSSIIIRFTRFSPGSALPRRSRKASFTM